MIKKGHVNGNMMMRIFPTKLLDYSKQWAIMNWIFQQEEWAVIEIEIGKREQAKTSYSCYYKSIYSMSIF
jgi:hypothetical protein